MIQTSKNFIVYKASAGSGKTFTLAKEFLKIALKNPDDYKKILAITFTNKAANEMKERIIKYLFDFIDENKDNDGIKKMFPKILEETNIDEHILLKNAKILLEKILYNYSDLSIMTIDSFFQRLLRTFAFDLNIPINYSIELQFDELLKQVIDLLIENVGEEDKENFNKIIFKYLKSKTDKENNWKIEDEILSISKNIFTENSFPFVEKIKKIKLENFIEIINSLNEESNNLKIIIDNNIKQLARELQNNNIPVDVFNYDFISKFIKNTKKYEIYSNSYIENALIEEKWFKKANEKIYSRIFEPIKEKIRNLILLIQEDIKKLRENSSIARNIYPTALLNEIYNLVKKVEKDENSFQLSHTNYKINAVVKNEPTPYIYERLGSKYFYYFIDEFQDTSRLQWYNLIPLLCEALSLYNNNSQGMAILFGDSKQSIYRFRGGNIEQFVELPNVPKFEENQIIVENQNILTNNFCSKPLDTNYRSCKNIIEFNNNFFKKMILDKEGEKFFNQFNTDIKNLQKIYEDVEQKTNENKGGFVSLKFFEKDEFIENVELQIFEIIKQAKELNFNYKDIAILSSANITLKKIANFLSTENIPIVSSETLLLKNSEKVDLLMSILKYLQYENNKIIAANIIIKFNKIFDIELVDIKSKIKNRKAIENYFNSFEIDFSFNSLEFLNIYEQTEYLIRVFHFQDNSDLYLLNLLDEINKFQNSKNSQSKFWEWWDEKKDKLSISIPDETDGIKLMSIHKSKGLEFPIVIFVNASQTNHPEDLWVKIKKEENNTNLHLDAVIMKDSDIKNTQYDNIYKIEQDQRVVDNLNKLYVCLTRACEKLFILSINPPKKIEKFSFESLLAEYTNTENSVFIKEESEYFFGERHQPKIDTKKINIESIEIDKLYSNNWLKDIEVNREIKDFFSIRWGNIIHFALSNIYNLNEIEYAYQSTIHKYDLNQTECNQLKDIIEKFITTDEVINIFNIKGKIINETDIIDEEGIIYRPDRVIINENEVVIIDFKTHNINFDTFENNNLNKKENDNWVENKYIKQLNNYKNLFEKMNYTNIRCYLIFISNFVKIVEL